MWVPDLGHSNSRAPALDSSYESQESMLGMVWNSLVIAKLFWKGKNCLLFSMSFIQNSWFLESLELSTSIFIIGTTELESSNLRWLFWPSTNRSRNGKRFFFITKIKFGLSVEGPVQQIYIVLMKKWFDPCSFDLLVGAVKHDRLKAWWLL